MKTNQDKTKITKLLTKIKSLAEQGLGGEKIEAEKLLAKLLKKYNLSEADLGSEELQELELTFKGKEEETLLLQICYKVFGNLDTTTSKVYRYKYGKGSRNTKLIECTPSQAAQIVLYYDFYRELWKQEKAKLLEAFIQKHSLFGKSSGEGVELSPEELKDLYKRMGALDEAESPSLRIEA